MQPAGNDASKPHMCGAQLHNPRRPDGPADGLCSQSRCPAQLRADVVMACSPLCISSAVVRRQAMQDACSKSTRSYGSSAATCLSSCRQSDDPDQHAGCTHASLSVEQNKTYLIRIVNAGTLDMESLCFVVRMRLSTSVNQTLRSTNTAQASRREMGLALAGLTAAGSWLTVVGMRHGDCKARWQEQHANLCHLHCRATR
jgi:hypothetical protein